VNDGGWLETVAFIADIQIRSLDTRGDQLQIFARTGVNYSPPWHCRSQQAFVVPAGGRTRCQDPHALGSAFLIELGKVDIQTQASPRKAGVSRRELRGTCAGMVKTLAITFSDQVIEREVDALVYRTRGSRQELQRARVIECDETRTRDEDSFCYSRQT
jgi:hypothetical protein